MTAKTTNNERKKGGLPKDLTAEMATIGSLLLDGSVLPAVAGKVSARDFVDPLAANVYRTITRLNAKGIAADSVLLVAELKKIGIDSGQAVAFLGECATATPHAGKAGEYAQIVRETSEKRSLIELSDHFAESVRNGQAPGDVLTSLLADAEDLMRAAGPREPRFPWITARDLAEGDFSVNYMVDGILVESQPCIIAGREKAMKTSIAVDLAISLAAGGHFLGRFPVTRPYVVGYMNGEGGYSQLKEIGQRIAPKAGRPLRDLDGLHFVDQLPRIGDATDHAELARNMAAVGMEALVVDAAYLAMPGDEQSNVAIQGELLKALNDTCRKCGVTLILLHHFRTTGAPQYGKPHLGLLCGAGYQEFARQWVLLSRQCEYEDGTGHHPLWLAAGGSAGHSCLWSVTIDEGTMSAVEGRGWEVTIETPAEAMEEQRRAAERRKADQQQRTEDEHCRKLVEVLRQFPGGETGNVLRETAGLNGKNFGAAVLSLQQRGQVRACQVVKKTGTYDGFQLVKN